MCVGTFIYPYPMFRRGLLRVRKGWSLAKNTYFEGWSLAHSLKNQGMRDDPCVLKRSHSWSGMIPPCAGMIPLCQGMIPECWGKVPLCVGMIPLLRGMIPLCWGKVPRLIVMIPLCTVEGWSRYVEGCTFTGRRFKAWAVRVGREMN